MKHAAYIMHTRKVRSIRHLTMVHTKTTLL